MSVMIFNLGQYRRMAAVLFAAKTPPQHEALTIDALAEIFAVANTANHAAFRATYAERADGYLARMDDTGRPLGKDAFISAFLEPVAVLEPELAQSDAELLLYNTADNDGVEQLTTIERLAVERVLALVTHACDRLIRTGQRRPERLQLVDPGTRITY
ncbi:MAG: hypothetical protein ACRCUE_12375 [Bosea sp. (in: a-proteobacteria)]